MIRTIPTSLSRVASCLEFEQKRVNNQPLRLQFSRYLIFENNVKDALYGFNLFIAKIYFSKEGDSNPARLT